MDSLVDESSALNAFKFEHLLTSIYPENIYRFSHESMDCPSFMNSSSSVTQSTSEARDESTEDVDYSGAMLKFMSQMLMEEEDLEHKPCMFYDCMALQATEKYFHDALNKPKSVLSSPINDDGFSQSFSSQGSESSSGVNSSIPIQEEYLNSSPGQFTYLDQALESTYPLNQGQDLFSYGEVGHIFPVPDDDNLLSYNLVGEKADERFKNHTNGVEEKRHGREDRDSVEDIRSNKLLASSTNDSDVDVSDIEEQILCSFPSDSLLQQMKQSKKSSTRRKPRVSKTKGIIITKEVVDLRSLLTQCAQAVADYDTRTANELIKKIKQHSSPSGDATERLAHYLTNALKARLEGTGTTLYTSFMNRISAAEVLKAYEVYITACPYKRMSNIFANRWIKKVASGAKKLHIIDFGILYGFQWPCLIQALSARPGGPPDLRITGIDFPQPGFRPAERVEETGRRLAKYCKRFNVPFEYKAIAKKWDTVKLEELEIDGEEVIAVNCLYRLENVPDETVLTNSPRDVVLKLIKRVKPDIFVHGVTNGTYNSPFFVTRFREALFHFSALYDMCEATVPSEKNQQRMLFEKEIFGRDAMNVVACEGTERVERPETYKQWQVRNVRAGFKQLSLDREIVNYVSDKVKKCYHKDFIVDQDGNWMLQGWKGKVINALSCWKATDKKRQQ